MSFSETLARVAKFQTKCLSLNDKPCTARLNLINLNYVELKNYPFMVSLDKRNGGCNVLSPKICVPKKTKDINIRVFNLITNKNETKTMTKHVSCE